MTLPVKSMTAFARCGESCEFGSITWEIRSVNHRYLDLHFKLPECFMSLEMEFRELLRKSLGRGRIDCCLHYQPNGTATSQLKINEILLDQLLENVNRVSAKLPGLVSVDPTRILAWPEVLQDNETDIVPLNKLSMMLLEKTIRELTLVRSQEGSGLRLAIKKILHEIHEEMLKIHKRVPAVIKTNKQKILDKLEEARVALDSNRVEQEMVFFIQKIDITEELDRLTIHLNNIQKILDDGGAVGKKMDFLTQELNREVNTIASKSADLEITNSAVAIKVFLEQIREQVQNLE